MPKRATALDIKSQIQTKCNELVESHLKPTHVQTPLVPGFNYIIDFATKWHGNYLYFIAIYACPDPNAISPTYEWKFARLKLVSRHRFNLSFHRHTGEWVELLSAVPLEECLDNIRRDPLFQP